MSEDGLSLGGQVNLELTEEEVRIVRAFIERIKSDREKSKGPSSVS